MDSARPSRDFNPLPPHGGRRKIVRNAKTFQIISIHSLRMEGDRTDMSCTAHSADFNPLPPHGGRLDTPIFTDPADIFQSTPSAWRETVPKISDTANIDISIHSLRMEGDYVPMFFLLSGHISIHSLRMEGDVLFTKVPAASELFQSTPSAWRETCDYPTPLNVSVVFQSTPSAWRETHDRLTAARRFLYFNPLPPHGGRRTDGICNNSCTPSFQSTPSAWRETGRVQCAVVAGDISIHSLRMEGDRAERVYPPTDLHFNPLPPHGGRRIVSKAMLYIKSFQSTPSAWRETWLR